GDRGDHLRRVAGEMLLEELEDAPRVLQRHVALRSGLRRSRRPAERITLGLVGPGRDVVGARRGVVPGEETVLEVVALADDEGRVRVVLHVVGVVEVVLEDVVDEPAEVGHVGTGADPQIGIGERGRPREARVRVDHLRAAARARPLRRIELGLHEPLEADRVRFRGVGAVDQDEVGVLDVTPVVRHRSSSERGGQTDHRWAVSDPGLLLQVDDAQSAHHLRGEVALFAAEGGASREGDALGAVDHVPARVLRDEGVVARGLDLALLRGLEVEPEGVADDGDTGGTARAELQELTSRELRHRRTRSMPVSLVRQVVTFRTVNEWFATLGRRWAAAAERRGAKILPPALEPDVAGELLELARVAAHTKERRFEPLASFTAGLAVERLRTAK